MAINRNLLEKLPHFQRRSFVPVSADLMRKETVTALYQKLLDQTVGSLQEFESWILRRSELDAALDQQGSILYILMTCQTDHAEFARDYKFFIETISPLEREMGFKLDKKFTGLAGKFSLDKERYRVYARGIETNIRIFHAKNVPLETELKLLCQEYQTMTGGMTVTFAGKERNLPEMNKFLQVRDRKLRERAWRAMAERRYQDRNKFDTLFDKMLDLRLQTAGNAGFERFIDFQFLAMHRFDYTPKHCHSYHQAVQEFIVPLWRDILLRRKKKLNLSALRPWDTEVDPWGQKPLKPFTSVRTLEAKVQQIFDVLDNEFAGQYAMLRKSHLLDLATRKGKAPGGYQSTLSEARLPFIFANACGVDDDVWTLLHEAGHAFHALACFSEPLLEYRHAPLEFCEVASMGMELLGGKHISVFYSKKDAQRSWNSHLEDIVRVLVWVAAVDAFQHWIYDHPGHSPEDRGRAWLEIFERFGGNFVHWQGLEENEKTLWHRQLHIFEYPLYYIEYGIAQLGALQIWRQAQQDFSPTIRRFKQALGLGGSRPLPELFSSAGLRFDFSRETISPVIHNMRKDLLL